MRQFIFVATILAAIAFAVGGPIAERDTPQPRLVSLGSVDGKTYFYDNVNRSWATAKQYCQDLGMRLATIRTSAQETFLKSKFASTGFTGYYWIGGRDARSINQFAWDVDNSAVTTVGQLWSFATHYTCLRYYSASSSSNGMWVSTLCTSTYQVICETF